MTRVRQTSELITHQIAAVPLPNSSLFVTVRDELGKPLIFSLGNDGVFYCFKENAHGARVLINLNQAFGLPDDVQATAFDVSQGRHDDRLYLAFAYQPIENEEKEAKTPLVLTYPFSPAEIDLEKHQELDLSSLIMPEAGATETSIEKVYMGPVSKRSHYPDVFLAYTPLSEVHKSADITRLHVGKDMSHWCVMSDLELPENASQIIDFCPAVLRVGPGFFLLYAIQGETQLIFSTTKDEDGFLFQVSLDCPKGAKCLATVQDESGFSSLLVGGQGLWFWDTIQAQRKMPGRLVSEDEGFEDVSQLYVTQNSKAVSVFAASADLGLSYCTTTSTTFQDKLDVIPLIPEGMGGTFSPFLGINTETQQLICSSPSDTQLTMLQQDLVTGTWKTKPLFLPALDKNLEFDAFIVTVSVTDDKRLPLGLQEFVLESEEGWVELFISGTERLVGPDGTKVMTDPQGQMILIIPTDDLNTGNFRLSHPELLPDGFTIDPVSKMFRKLESINSGRDLRNARIPSGERLLEGTNLSNDEIDQLGEAFKAVNQEKKKMDKKKNGEEEEPSSEEPVVLAGSSKAPFGGTLLDAGRAVLHFIRNTVDKVTDKEWWIQSFNGAIEFVIQIGGKAWKWVVEKVNDLLDILSTIWSKIVDAWEKFKLFLKLLFDWKEIIKFKNGIVGMVNGAFESSVEIFPVIEQHVENFFDNFQDTIGDFIYPDALDDITSEDTDGADGAGDETESALSYVKENMSNGGSMSKSVGLSPPEGERDLTEAEKQVLDIFGPIKTAVLEAGERLKNTMDQRYFLSGKMSFKDTIQTVLADTAMGFIDILKGVIQTVVRMAGASIVGIKLALNQPIRIPVFSALYEMLTGRKFPNFSMLDLVGFVIAIPCGAVSVAATGKWPDLPSKDEFKSFLGGYGSSKKKESPEAGSSLSAAPAAAMSMRSASLISSTGDSQVRLQSFDSQASVEITTKSDLQADEEGEEEEEEEEEDDDGGERLPSIGFKGQAAMAGISAITRTVKCFVDSITSFPYNDQDMPRLKTFSFTLAILRLLCAIPFNTAEDRKTSKIKIATWGMSCGLDIIDGIILYHEVHSGGGGSSLGSLGSQGSLGGPLRGGGPGSSSGSSFLSHGFTLPPGKEFPRGTPNPMFRPPSGGGSSVGGGSVGGGSVGGGSVGGGSVGGGSVGGGSVGGGSSVTGSSSKSSVKPKSAVDKFRFCLGACVFSSVAVMEVILLVDAKKSLEEEKAAERVNDGALSKKTKIKETLLKLQMSDMAFSCFSELAWMVEFAFEKVPQVRVPAYGVAVGMETVACVLSLATVFKAIKEGEDVVITILDPGA